MKRILLIDDDEPIRLSLGELLRIAGYAVVAAADGREGLDLFRQQSFDLVITDVLMPRMDGAATIAALRGLRPGVKVIAMYGGGRVSETNPVANANNLGADRLLAKPFTAQELNAAIAAVLLAAEDKAGHS
jgi:DNA-binding response OmpR family regulator